MQVVSTASKIKHSDVYYQDINYKFIFIILYLQQTLQPIRSLQDTMQTIHTMCEQLVFSKFVNPHQINTQKCNFQHTFILH